MEFGTAGLRGIIGAGTNRLNTYTIGRVTDGLASYLFAHKKSDIKVAISYDMSNFNKLSCDCQAYKIKCQTKCLTYTAYGLYRSI